MLRVEYCAPIFVVPYRSLWIMIYACVHIRFNNSTLRLRRKWLPILTSLRLLSSRVYGLRSQHLKHNVRIFVAHSTSVAIFVAQRCGRPQLLSTIIDRMRQSFGHSQFVYADRCKFGAASYTNPRKLFTNQRAR